MTNKMQQLDKPVEKTKYDRKCYTIADFYESYLQSIDRDTVYDIGYKKFRTILNDYFKYIADEVMLNGKEFKFPCRMGTLQIIKHKPKNYNSKSLRIDFQSSKQLGKKIYFLNEHSDGYKYRFHYCKQNCLTKNKSKYQFVASRANKRKLATLIFSKYRDYPEL